MCAFNALTLLVGRKEGHLACKKTEWWGAGVAICLERGADLHTAGNSVFRYSKTEANLQRIFNSCIKTTK